MSSMRREGESERETDNEQIRERRAATERWRERQRNGGRRRERDRKREREGKRSKLLYLMRARDSGVFIPTPFGLFYWPLTNTSGPELVPTQPCVCVCV